MPENYQQPVLTTAFTNPPSISVKLAWNLYPGSLNPRTLRYFPISPKLEGFLRTLRASVFYSYSYHFFAGRKVVTFQIFFQLRKKILIGKSHHHELHQFEPKIAKWQFPICVLAHYLAKTKLCTSFSIYSSLFFGVFCLIMLNSICSGNQ